MNITVRQLETLVAAADALSFSQAAEKLGISQPSLSETIRRIETELGFRVFDRTTRSLVLTAEGRRAVATAREAVRDFRSAVESLATRTEGRGGRISIAALPSVACAVLPAAMRRFSSEFPQVEIAVADVLHERALGLVQDGLADLALTIRPGKLAGLEFQELGSDAMRLLCRADHALAKRRTVRWRELAAYPFVALARTSSVRRLTDAAFINAEVALEPTFEVEQIPSAAALVEAGLGVTALPSLTFTMFKGSGLVMRPLVEPALRRHVGILILSGRTPSALMLRLAALLRESFRAL
jgi:LysR family carnitine catabolism transcriptional activator